MAGTFEKMGKNYSHVIYDITSASSPDMGFATWGKPSDALLEDVPLSSDHQIPDDLFADNYFVNKAAIYQAIDVMSADEVDVQLKNETIAILLLLVGENQKALEILNE